MTLQKFIERANIVGLKPHEWREMTLGEFFDYEWGFFYRQALEYDRMRALLLPLYKLAGDTKSQQPKDLFAIWQLDNLEEEEEDENLLDGEMALKALKAFGVIGL